jgi:hypothetical protein
MIKPHAFTLVKQKMNKWLKFQRSYKKQYKKI